MTRRTASVSTSSRSRPQQAKLAYDSVSVGLGGAFRRGAVVDADS
jgi:hypothetical protein